MLALPPAPPLVQRPFALAHPALLVIHYLYSVPIPPFCFCTFSGGRRYGATAKSNKDAVQVATNVAKAAADTEKAAADAAKVKARTYGVPSAVKSRGKTRARPQSPLEMTAGQSGCQMALGQTLTTFVF